MISRESSRQDYKSDDEREQCGDRGCAVLFSTHLDPHVEPIVDVTAPPSFAPTISPISHGGMNVVSLIESNTFA